MRSNPESRRERFRAVRVFKFNSDWGYSAARKLYRNDYSGLYNPFNSRHYPYAQSAQSFASLLRSPRWRHGAGCPYGEPAVRNADFL
jgi:hypothetical protein